MKLMYNLYDNIPLCRLSSSIAYEEINMSISNVNSLLRCPNSPQRDLASLTFAVSEMFIHQAKHRVNENFNIFMSTMEDFEGSKYSTDGLC